MKYSEIKNKISKSEGFRSETERYFPSIINICVLRGKCNCNCTHCPVGRISVKERIKKFSDEEMSLLTFKKIVSQTSKYQNTTIRIHAVGEPLLWKNLEKALAYSESINQRIWIFTSLVTTNNYLLLCLAKSEAIIEVSVNSYSEEDYTKTKGINQFKVVINNIKYLSDIIKKFNLKTRLIVSRVESRSKIEDEQFLDFWLHSGLVNDAFVRSYHDYNGSIKKCGPLIKKDQEKSVKKITDPCLVHWSRLNIDTNGDVVVCFNELFKGKRIDKILKYGNIKDTSIKEIWNGNKINKIRIAQLTKNYDGSDFLKKLPCINCKFCQPLYGNRVTSENQIQKFQEQIISTNPTIENRVSIK